MRLTPLLSMDNCSRPSRTAPVLSPSLWPCASEAGPPPCGAGKCPRCRILRWHGADGAIRLSDGHLCRHATAYSCSTWRQCVYVRVCESADDGWPERAEELIRCAEKVAEYDAATPRSRARSGGPEPSLRLSRTSLPGPQLRLRPGRPFLRQLALATAVLSGNAVVGRWVVHCDCSN